MKKAVIFGCGREGCILHYTLSSQYQIIYYVDNRIGDSAESTFMELPLRNPHYLISDNKWDIVIISSLRYMPDMGKQLDKMGFSYGTDYLLPYDVNLGATVIDAELFIEMDIFPIIIDRMVGERKLAIVYGNCQSEVIVSLLSQNRDFVHDYLLVKLPPIHYDSCLKVVEVCIDSGIWNRCELFVTQYVKDGNRFSSKLSTNYLCSILPENCKKLIIPDLYFKGYFPDAYDLPKEYRVLDKYFGGTGLFANGYRMIDRWVLENKSIEDILDRLHSSDLYSEDYILSSIEDELEYFKNKEISSGVTVQISDYIRQNYRKKLLFHCFHHPSIELLTELCNRILCELGIRDNVNENYNLNWHMSNYGMLLYPSVIETLGLKSSYLSMIYYPWSGSKGMSFDELSVCYINFRKRIHVKESN